MKNIFLNNKILLGASVVIGIIGLILSYCSQDFLWFARSGSIIVGIGIIFISRTSFTGSDLLPEVMGTEGYLTNSPEYYTSQNEPIPDAVTKDVQNRKAIQLLSPIITFLGTIIWGFGDLLNCLFHFTSKSCS